MCIRDRDSAKAFCEAHPELDAYFICSGEGDKYETYFTDGMKTVSYTHLRQEADSNFRDFARTSQIKSIIRQSRSLRDRKSVV